MVTGSLAGLLLVAAASPGLWSLGPRLAEAPGRVTPGSWFSLQQVLIPASRLPGSRPRSVGSAAKPSIKLVTEPRPLTQASSRRHHSCPLVTRSVAQGPGLSPSARRWPGWRQARRMSVPVQGEASGLRGGASCSPGRGWQLPGPRGWGCCQQPSIQVLTRSKPFPPLLKRQGGGWRSAGCGHEGAATRWAGLARSHGQGLRTPKVRGLAGGEGWGSSKRPGSLCGAAAVSVLWVCPTARGPT